MPLDPEIAALLERLNAQPSMVEGTPEQARAGFRHLNRVAAKLHAPAEVGAVRELEVEGGAARLPARLYLPPGAGGAVPSLVFFHGGGFTIGDVGSYDAQCRALCAGAGVAVLSVEYRLAPENRFPAAVEDAIAATRWALEHAGELGGDAGAVAVGGDSAGANLAAVAAQALRGSEPALVAQLLMYPVTDFCSTRPSHTANGEGLFLTGEDMTWFRLQYLGDGRRDDPRASPLLADDLSGLPPAVVVTAEYDPLRDDGEAYADALAEAGVEVVRARFDGLIHGFFGLGPFSAAAAAAVDRVCADFRHLLAEANVRA